MQVSHLDHLVLTVRDIEVTAAFYEAALGMQRVEFAGGRVALSFGQQKINLHQLGREFEPKAGSVAAGSADLCFIIDDTLEQAVLHLRSCKIEIIEGPVQRTGAVGPIHSLYIRDPDQNLIEIARYV